MPKNYFINNILLESGWAKDVTITVSDSGIIEGITGVEDASVCSHSAENKGNLNSRKTTQNIENYKNNSLIDNSIEHINGIVIPGMANVHSHSFQRAIAGLTESKSVDSDNSSNSNNDNFWSWREMMYHFVDKITPDQQYIIAKQLYLECLKSGYTSVGEFHYLHHDKNGKHYADINEASHHVINAALDCGIGITHLPVYYRYSGFEQQSRIEKETRQKRFVNELDDFTEMIELLYSQYNTHPSVNIGIAPHSLRAVNVEDINLVVEHLKLFNDHAPIHIHIAEQLLEVQDCLSVTGQRPINHLLDNCKVDSSWCLIHATHIEKEELKAVSSRNANIGLCPTTEANLGDGIFPAKTYINDQGKFSIGSDSHISVSPFEELRLLEYGQRLTHNQRNVMCTEQRPSVGTFLYQHASKHGASALQQNSGVIEVGRYADWVVLDSSHIDFIGKYGEQLLDSAIFMARSNAVKDVMVHGQWKVKDKYHLEEETTLEQFTKLMNELLCT